MNIQFGTKPQAYTNTPNQPPIQPQESLGRTILNLGNSASNLSEARTIEQSRQAGKNIIWDCISMGCQLLWKGSKGLVGK